MTQRDVVTKEIVIELATTKRDDGCWEITIPKLPMFHVVGGSERLALDAAQSVLTEHLKLNYNVTVVRMRPVEGMDTVLESGGAISSIPVHVIAELAAE